ncbi:MAG: PAS domain S-box protein [Desulfobacterales bacterium]|uniref:histidine kinase n=1 Tax=Candidatus Desulfatibia vada TaxID=2841696 RepID=A0A8J6TL94_9BACT|nr:PAS domain S-box protein [Candidatus Desulfatibia vada]
MGKKLLVGFIIVVLLMVVLAVYLTDVSQHSLQQAVGTNSILLAGEMLERINSAVYDKIEELQSHLTDESLQNIIRHSNKEFENLDSLQEYVTQKDREWVQTPKDQITPFMQVLIHNELSNHLRRELVEFYNNKYGYKFFGEIIVTNKYGANVAQTGRTSDYRQDDETWWQIARDTGFYVSDIAYDVSAGIYAVSISVRIEDENGDFIGAIKAILAVKDIVRTEEIATRKHKTTEIKLTTKDGKLIYATKVFKILEDVSGKEYFKNIKGANGSFIAVEDGIKRLYSYTRSTGYREFAGLGWILLVGHDVAEVLQPAIMLKNHMIAASLVLILLSMVIASFFYAFISKAEAQIQRQSAILDAINKVFRKALACDKEEDLALICLAIAEELTASKFGFIGEITSKGRYNCLALSDPGWEACRVPESHAPLLMKNMKISGIWGRVLQDEKSLISNDPASHPDRAGPPPGHPPITSFLGVPLKHSGKTIGLIALGNKKGGYTLHNQHAVETLSVAVVEALMRYRAKEELREYRHHLEDLVESRTAKLEESNQRLQAEIIERIQTAEALKESEEKYRSILDSIEDGYWEVDIDGNYTFFNDAMCRILRYPKDELAGMNNRKYMDKENAKKVLKTFNNVYRTGISTRALDWKLIRKDGSECFIETMVSLMKDPDGQPTGFRGVARDITERKLGEVEKKKMAAQLQQVERMESLGTLAGGVAHDFNNLLMGIQGRTSLMMIDEDFTHRHLEHLRSIEKYVVNATDLTKQLLGFARGGKYEVKPSNLNELVKNNSEMFGRTKKEITIHSKFQENIWPVAIDRGQIEQVLLNLYVNAWHSMPGGGDLYIETENLMLNKQYVESYQKDVGRYVKITITDTGIGMDKATQTKIFEPFFTTKEMGRGTGLGLASVYGIINNHDGFISVYSEKGIGTTFNIFLPTSEKEVVEEKRPSDDISKGTETVLIVDDEQMIIDVSKALLAKMGYNVLTAGGGKEALEIYKAYKLKIDLVILDMIMPNMGGSETFDQLKEINPDVKVLLSSGYSIDGQATEILERGCSGFIQKPFNLKRLSQKLRNILDKK